MAKRMLVNVTPDCSDGKSPEDICNSADGKLRRLWIGESGDSQKLRVVPEAYRQKFRTQRKKESQSYIEFQRDKENALEKWCDSKRIEGDVEKLRQLILAEEFLNCVPEEIRVHLSERKTDLSYKMTALVDEYTLTHRKTEERVYMGSQGSRAKIKAELRP